MKICRVKTSERKRGKSETVYGVNPINFMRKAPGVGNTTPQCQKVEANKIHGAVKLCLFLFVLETRCKRHNIFQGKEKADEKSVV